MSYIIRIIDCVHWYHWMNITQCQFMVQLHECANISILFCKFMSTSASFILKFSGFFFLKKNHSLKILYFFLWWWNVMKIVIFQQLVMKRWIQLLHSILCNLFFLTTPLFMFQVLLKVFCYGKQLMKRKMEVGDNNIIHSGIVNISGCSVKIRLL